MSEKKMVILCRILAGILAVLLAFDVSIFVIRKKKQDKKTKNPSVEMTATTGDAEELPEATATDAAGTTETVTDAATEEQLLEPVAISIEDIPELDSLYATLHLFENYGTDVNKDYSNENPPDNLLRKMLVGDEKTAEYSIVDLTLAPQYQCQVETTTTDYENYARYSAAGVEWIEKHVLNLSDDAITELRKKCSQEKPDEFENVYFQDGEYCLLYDTVSGGLHDGCYNQILNVETDGSYYYLTVDSYNEWQYADNGNSIDGLSPWISRTSWKMKLKTVDNVTFWSIYECKSLSTEWARAYYDYFFNNVDDMNSVISSAEGYYDLYCVYITEDDNPELLFDNTTYGGYQSFILTYDAGKVKKIPIRFSSMTYIEKSNKCYVYGGTGGSGGEFESLFYIHDGVAERVSNKQCLTFENNRMQYLWNEKEVTEAECDMKLNEAYDKDAAINISEHFIMQIEQRMDVSQWLLVQYK